MSIIPFICYNYLVESIRRREEDDNSYRENNNRVYGNRTIPVGLSSNGYSGINEYRKDRSSFQKQINEKGGFKL